MTVLEHMPMQVFEMARSWAEEPLTIFAADVGEAQSIYAAWVETHHPERPTRPVMVYPYAGFLLEERPELIFGCSTGTAGVGVWNRVGRRWIFVTPGEPLIGDLMRPFSAVKFHQVSASEGDELMVFAESFEEAVGY